MLDTETNIPPQDGFSQSGSKAGYDRVSVPKMDLKQTEEFAKMISDKGGCLEVRIIGDKTSQNYQGRQSHVGFYSNVSALIRDVKQYHGKKPVYVGLNPRKSELLHALSAANALNAGASGAGNDDVLCRLWFPIDIDSIRSSKKVAASQVELEAALKVRDCIFEEMRSRGIQPISGMSGNGGHLLVFTTVYPIDKERDGKNGDVALLLRSFNRRFGTEMAGVDTSVFDPARIWKLYGTCAIKGGNTIERPWRTATFEPPEKLPEPADILEIYKNEIQEQREFEAKEKVSSSHQNTDKGTSQARSAYSGNIATLDIVELFRNREMHFHLVKEKMHSVRCPWADQHTTGEDGDSSTVIFEAHENKWPGFKCQHEHCVMKSIKEVLEWFGVDDVNKFCKEKFQNHHANSANPKKGFTFIKLGELFIQPDEKVDYLVDGILPKSGTSILAAKPKTGKTTLARQLALCVAGGQSFLNRPSIKGPVIYIAAEEKISEVKRHFREMRATGQEEIYIHAASTPRDAINLLREKVVELKAELVIIDTLFRVVRVKDGNDYAGVTAALEPIQDLARETRTHVMCVHHMGKVEREGGDGMLGSTAISGSADTLIFLSRKEKKRFLKTMQRYGNDIEETELVFNFVSRTTSMGETKKASDTTKVINEIASFLIDNKEPATEKEIRETLGGNKALRLKALREGVGRKRFFKKGKGTGKDPFKYEINLYYSPGLQDQSGSVC